MAMGIADLWRGVFSGARRNKSKSNAGFARPRRSEIRPFKIDPNDPLLRHIQEEPSVIEVNKIDLDSPLLRALRSVGIQLAVPLVSQGELIGLLNLGRRLSEQEYSTDDHGLLDHIASQAAPALRLAQLVRQRQTQAQELERVEQELKVARLIQHTLLPQELPKIPGWQLDVHYQPAREVGGDFYDFFVRPDGRIVIVVGDVTDKGVPAALVMATLRAILRGAMRRMLSPGAALERSNNLLLPEIPQSMFVTCLYSILDPTTGRLEYANAGHDLPIRNSNGVATELLATGMPLGLMPDMKYEEKVADLEVGDSLLLYSDGLVEAHDPHHEMFGFPRLRESVASHRAGIGLIPYLLHQLAVFTGDKWTQEDDVTLLTLVRCEQGEDATARNWDSALEPPDSATWQRLGEFLLLRNSDIAQNATKMVTEIVRVSGLSHAQLARLNSAVATVVTNAADHPDSKEQIVAAVRVYSSENGTAVCIAAPSGDYASELETPLRTLVDEVRVQGSDHGRMVQLIVHRDQDERPQKHLLGA